MLKIGLDIDDTITACQGLFSLMTEAVKQKGGQVYIISSRTDVQEVREETKEQLLDMRICFDELYLLPNSQQAMKTCPHKELDWYEKFLWQKVDYCKQKGITIFFDDEQKVIDLFHKYAPEVKVFRACKNQSPIKFGHLA
jgi:hypothetical protein